MKLNNALKSKKAIKTYKISMIFFLILFIISLLIGCVYIIYQNEQEKVKLNDIRNDITQIRQEVNKVNTNAESIQSTVDSVESNVNSICDSTQSWCF